MANTSNHAHILREKIDSHRAKVAVVGLGYVGLPLGLAFAECGFDVLGLDVDAGKVEALAAGRSYIQHIAGENVKRVVEAGRFEGSVDFGRLAEADAVVICVPTPLSAQRDPDLSYVEGTARAVLASLRPGQLIVLESTTYPGTTDGLVASILAESGLILGEDYFLAFSPEREDPGNAKFNTVTIPKVVGGVGEASGDLAEALYARIIASVVRVSSAAAAEATKLTENIFRAVNIALVNELKVIYEKMGVDVWEVLDAAATKPFGFMRFSPGPGWGGHCIPLDPFYLSWKAREYGLDTRFIELAGQINRGMPGYVVDRLRAGLNDQHKSIKGSKVLVLGLAYKKDVGDTRESPAYEIIKRLLDDGAVVNYHDPLVAMVPQTRSWPGHPEMHSMPLTKEGLVEQDAVVVVTDHSSLDYEMVAQHSKLVVDTRGVYRGAAPNLVKA